MIRFSEEQIKRCRIKSEFGPGVKEKGETARRTPANERYRQLLEEGKPGGSKKKNKYNARRTTLDGITFHSAKEAARYQDLQLLAAAGEIENLELQVPYELEINGVLITTYVADFRYLDAQTGEIVVEDAKGKPTREYEIKRNLMLALLGITILET